MSITTLRNSISRAQADIATLHNNDAREAKKEATLSKKASDAARAASQTKNASMANSKLNEHQRALSQLADVQKKRADIKTRLAQKSRQLGQYEDQLHREEKRLRAKAAAEEKKLSRERSNRAASLLSELTLQRHLVAKADKTTYPITTLPYDFFISHASEDKDEIARPLADELRLFGARVWFDEAVLIWGESLRRQIDAGLANCRFGIVILSQNFFAKEWPQRELDGLATQEVAGVTRILPIWHKLTVDEVRRRSPTLADKLARSTATESLDQIVHDLLNLIQPRDTEV